MHKDQKIHLRALSDIVLNVSDTITFSALEIGAAPVSGDEERFHQLLDIFPNSTIYAFELDEGLCRELNQNSRQGLQYFPVALGRTKETRTLYETAHPMCSSLYRPHEELLRQYNHLEVAQLKNMTSIETVSLDRFVKDNDIREIDFIKIDIQGAELDVFQGGVTALKNTLMIISEVEFIPHYIDQPLFGDVCGFLADRNLMFHKFASLGSRNLKPIVFDGNPNKGSQLVWADAVFIRDILQLPELSVDKLLKMAVLSLLYGSFDLTHRCLTVVDQKRQTDTSRKFLEVAGRLT